VLVASFFAAAWREMLKQGQFFLLFVNRTFRVATHLENLEKSGKSGQGKWKKGN